MPTRPLNLNVDGILTVVRIEVRSDPLVGASDRNRLLLEGRLQDAASGELLRTVNEDVTASLTDAETAAIDLIVARGQAWIDAK